MRRCAGLQAVVQRQRQDDQKNAKEHVHEQVGRKGDHLHFDEQGHLLGRVGYAGVVQNDEKDGHSDQVGDCQVQGGETAKFLQGFHFLLLLFLNQSEQIILNETVSRGS